MKPYTTLDCRPPEAGETVTYDRYMQQYVYRIIVRERNGHFYATPAMRRNKDDDQWHHWFNAPELQELTGHDAMHRVSDWIDGYEAGQEPNHD